MLRRWTSADDALLATLTPAEVSRRTGRSLNSIQKRRWKLKHRGAEFPDYRYTAERRKAGRSVWTPEADELVRNHRPYIVARMLGVSDATAQRRRLALGLPPIGRNRVPKPPRTKPLRVVKKWTKAELRIVLSLPPHESIKRLPGRSMSAIHAVRNMRKRQGVKFKAAKRGTRKGTKHANIHRDNGRRKPARAT